MRPNQCCVERQYQLLHLAPNVSIDASQNHTCLLCSCITPQTCIESMIYQDSQLLLHSAVIQAGICVPVKMEVRWSWWTRLPTLTQLNSFLEHGKWDNRNHHLKHGLLARLIKTCVCSAYGITRCCLMEVCVSVHRRTQWQLKSQAVSKRNEAWERKEGERSEQRTERKAGTVI